MRDMKEADINPYVLICHTSIRDKGFPIFMCNFQSLFPGLLLSLFQPSAPFPVSAWNFSRPGPASHLP